MIQTPENEHDCSFSGVVDAGERSKPQRRAVMLVFGGGGGQRYVETPKMSRRAHFWGWWCKRMVETLKMNMPVHFWGWWLSENIQNPRK